MSESKYFVWDGIECELTPVDSIEDGEKLIKEDYIDKVEGVHPDIESCFILEKKLTAKINLIHTRDDFTQDEWMELHPNAENFDEMWDITFE